MIIWQDTFRIISAGSHGIRNQSRVSMPQRIGIFGNTAIEAGWKEWRVLSILMFSEVIAMLSKTSKDLP
jgi:hypothetical protein